MSRILTLPYPTAAPPPPDTVLLDDSLTGSDGTDLTAHTPEVGGPWVNWGGSLQLSGNVALVVTDGTRVADTGRADVTITARIKCGAANGNFAPTVILRGTDSTHYLMVYFSGDGNLQLYWRRDATFELLATTTWSADASWHDVVVATDGTDIAVTIDGGAPWDTWSLQQAAGTFHGIRGFKVAANADSFDDVLVEAVASPTTYPGPYVTSLLTEDFNESNGTTLASLGFTEGNGAWTCQSNQAEQADVDGDANGYTVYDDVVEAEVALECKITTPSSGQFITGLAFRIQDATHFIEVELNTSTTYTPNKGFGCWYTNGGVTFIEVVTSPFVPVVNTTYTVRVTLIGTRVICEVVEAGLRMEGDTAMFQTETEHGLFEYRDATRPNANHYNDLVILGA